MTRRTVLLSSVLLFTAAWLAVAQDSAEGALAVNQTLAVSVTVQVIASDQEQSSQRIAAWAEDPDTGGYFTLRSAEQVLVRIPPGNVPALREVIEGQGDTIVMYNPSAVDYREELARSRAAIDSRTESLNRILEFLETADITATLSFERELRSLLQEIEYYTGQIRRMTNEIRYAVVTVNLSSRQRTIPEQRPSTFEWINTVDLYRFLQEARP